MKAGMKNEYDIIIIIIGYGLGGLTCAALMSKMFKKKVLVLEKHTTLGGQTHEFRRKEYKWDVGLHYVGGMVKGEDGRKVMDFITDGNLDWKKMPDRFDVFHYPGFSFQESSDPQQYQDDLITLFPDEHKGIKHYFKDLEKASKENGLTICKKQYAEISCRHY